MPNAITEHAAPKRRQITIVTKRITAYLQRTKEINSSELRELASQCSFLYYFLGPRSRRTLSSFCSDDERHLSATFRVISFQRRKKRGVWGVNARLWHSHRQNLRNSPEPWAPHRQEENPKVLTVPSLPPGRLALSYIPAPLGVKTWLFLQCLTVRFPCIEYDAKSACDWAIKAHFFDCEKAASFQVSVTAQKSRGKMIF